MPRGQGVRGSRSLRVGRKGPYGRLFQLPTTIRSYQPCTARGLSRHYFRGFLLSVRMGLLFAWRSAPCALVQARSRSRARNDDDWLVTAREAAGAARAPTTGIPSVLPPTQRYASRITTRSYPRGARCREMGGSRSSRRYRSGSGYLRGEKRYRSRTMRGNHPP